MEIAKKEGDIFEAKFDLPDCEELTLFPVHERDIDRGRPILTFDVK